MRRAARAELPQPYADPHPPRPDLYRMYTLLSRIPDGLEPLRRQFEEHVKRKGAAAVEKEAGTNVQAMEPAAYVAALLSVHSKFVGVINNAFRSEAGELA